MGLAEEPSGLSFQVLAIPWAEVPPVHRRRCTISASLAPGKQESRTGVVYLLPSRSRHRLFHAREGDQHLSLVLLPSEKESAHATLQAGQADWLPSCGDYSQKKIFIVKG